MLTHLGKVTAQVNDNVWHIMCAMTEQNHYNKSLGRKSLSKTCIIQLLDKWNNWLNYLNKSVSRECSQIMKHKSVNSSIGLKVVNIENEEDFLRR